MKLNPIDFTKRQDSNEVQNTFQSRSGNSEINVLIIDDIQAMRTSLRSNLIEQGFKHVFIANDGFAGKKIIDKEKINMIISDWNMPKMTGLELLEYVKGNDKLAHIHFMLVTAESDRKHIDQAIAEGVDNFLVKPFTAKKLITKVQQMLEHPTRPKQQKSLSSATSKSKPTKKRPLSSKPIILVVDDVSTNIDVINGMLKNDYKIKFAINGEKALKIAVSEPQPDLILLDVMMPEMDGYEVCQKLKQAPETESIPVIFLTAKAETADIAKGFALGGVDYITKPAIPEVLKARVKTHVQLKHSKDDLAFQVDNLLEMAKLRDDVELITRHDLKNPLSAIINTSDTLLKSQYMGVEQRQSVETIREFSYDMLGMINRSLDLYKMEKGVYKLKPTSFDIVQTTQKLVNESRTIGHELGIAIEFEATSVCMALGEELLCLSLLGNLIRNAVEATQKEGVVKVKVQYDEKVKIYIHNTALIPEDMRENFFEKYATSGKNQGTGLGTYSARLMAKAQHGNIAFSSKEGKGTTLLVTLPIAPDFDHLKESKLVTKNESDYSI